MAEKGGISVQTEHIFPIIKRWLYSDKEIFLRELVSNAADAETKLKHLVAVGQATGIQGDYRIDVTVDKDEKTIVVEDNGIGIDKEHLPRVCERFYRVDKSRSKSTGGTGLGLAIVKRVCALYGAKLSMESELGKGTRVMVLFKK